MKIKQQAPLLLFLVLFTVMCVLASFKLGGVAWGLFIGAFQLARLIITRLLNTGLTTIRKKISAMKIGELIYFTSLSVSLFPSYIGTVFLIFYTKDPLRNTEYSDVHLTLLILLTICIVLDIYLYFLRKKDSEFLR